MCLPQFEHSLPAQLSSTVDLQYGHSIIIISSSLSIIQLQKTFVNFRRFDIIRQVFNIVGKEFKKLADYDAVIDKLGGVFDDSVVQEKAFAQSGLTKAVYEYITSLGVSSAAEMTFSQKLKLSTIALKEQAAAFIASPLGKAAVIGAAIFAIVKIVDALTVSLEDSREKLDELKSEYNDNESELQSLNSELQTTIDRIEELEGKDTLTFTEAEELQNLKKQNAELERQIALYETIQRQKNQEIYKTFIDTMNKDVNDVDDKKFNSSGTWTTTKYDDLVSENYNPTDYKYWRKESGGHITRISEREYIEAVMMRREEIVSALAGSLEADEEKQLESLLKEIDDYLVTKSQEFTGAAEGISYINNPTTDDERAVNEWLNFINDYLFSDQLQNRRLWSSSL